MEEFVAEAMTTSDEEDFRDDGSRSVACTVLGNKRILVFKKIRMNSEAIRFSTYEGPIGPRM